MKKTLATVLAVVLSLLPSIGASDNDPVSRVVSLDLCSDWMLARYADRTQVLALSPLIKQYPVDWVGQGWPVHNGSLEHILELQPDLVITGEYNALLLRQRLQDLGVRVEVMALPTSLEQIAAYEQRFLGLLGQPAERASSAPDGVGAAKDAPRLLLLGANAIGTGRKTFEDGIIRRAGWQNYLTEEGYITLDLEQIVRQPPDALLWAAPDSPALASHFAEHPVLAQVIDAEDWLSTDYWRWQCPGPWTWELIEQLQQWHEH